MKAAIKDNGKRSYQLMLLVAFKSMAACSFASRIMQCGMICQSNSEAWNLFTCRHEVVSLWFLSQTKNILPTMLERSLLLAKKESKCSLACFQRSLHGEEMCIETSID